MQQSVSKFAPPSAMYRLLGDRIFAGVVAVLAASIIVLTVALAFFLYQGGAEAIQRFGLFGFPTNSTWDPGLSRQFGAWPFILGTILTSISALALSILPALAAAIFSAEYAPRWLAGIIDYLVDLMAAIPSVVYGIWGIFVLAPFLRDTLYLPLFTWSATNATWLTPFLGAPTGYGMFTAIIILTSMVIPYTASLARDAIRLVPIAQREAAYGLGATRWEVMRLAILPYARGGIIAGAILSLGRALGETMAVAMVIGNSNVLPFTFFGGASTMPSVIALELKEAVEDIHYSSLIAVGFYLFIVAFIVNIIASYLLNRLKVGGPRL